MSATMPLKLSTPACDYCGAPSYVDLTAVARDGEEAGATLCRQHYTRLQQYCGVLRYIAEQESIEFKGDRTVNNSLLQKAETSENDVLTQWRVRIVELDAKHEQAHLKFLQARDRLNDLRAQYRAAKEANDDDPENAAAASLRALSLPTVIQRAGHEMEEKRRAWAEPLARDYMLLGQEIAQARSAHMRKAWETMDREGKAAMQETNSFRARTSSVLRERDETLRYFAELEQKEYLRTVQVHVAA